MLRFSTISSRSDVFVTDNGNNRVEKFTSTGTFLTKWGSLGSGDGQLNFPTGLAVDGTRNVFVVDNGNSRIQKFTNTGTFLIKWGTMGSGDGQFSSPHAYRVEGRVTTHPTATNSPQGGNISDEMRSMFPSLTQWLLPQDVRRPNRHTRGGADRRRLVMKKSIGGLAVLACGAGFMAQPALARCRRDCKTLIRTEFKSCKAACGKDKTCKQGCGAEKKAAMAACKAATSPTPPNCGGTDDEGATTTTTLSGSTTTTPSGSTTTTTMGPTTHTVHVGPASAPLTFAPLSLTIGVGDTVQWVWDSSGHDVVSGTNCSEDGTFCSPSDTNCATIQLSNAGAMYQHTFPAAGTFPYFCAVHCALGMTGSITVQ